MPSGVVHTRTTSVAAVALPVFLWYVGQPLIAITSATLGCMTGLVISPDSDVDNGFIGFDTIRRFYGNPVAIAWRVFWWPYAKIVKHRSFISHSFVIGTLIRLLYITLPILTIMTLLSIPIPQISLESVAWFVIGLSISDGLHIVMDNVFKR
jgi:uncharacterized metal-binding protein